MELGHTNPTYVYSGHSVIFLELNRQKAICQSKHLGRNRLKFQSGIIVCNPCFIGYHIRIESCKSFSLNGPMIAKFNFSGLNSSAAKETTSDPVTASIFLIAFSGASI